MDTKNAAVKERHCGKAEPHPEHEFFSSIRIRRCLCPGEPAPEPPNWRDQCCHYGPCPFDNRGLCTAPDDPAYIAEMEKRYA